VHSSVTLLLPEVLFDNENRIDQPGSECRLVYDPYIFHSVMRILYAFFLLMFILCEFVNYICTFVLWFWNACIASLSTVVSFYWLSY